ncbi:MAG: hypothetical protein KatS3mg105_0651 [Gemmatales bacterium]|nr:MAG: hypothetical protein KatS3mg105_0651 [Gemmatales bacterium]
MNPLIVRFFAGALFVFVSLAGLPLVRADQDKSPIFDSAPKNVEELKAIQNQVRAVLPKILPCTVCVRIGAGQGSGVIVDKEGHVLTAGHVSGAANRNVILVLHDGKTVKGKTLGSNRLIDSGMIKITDKGEFPFAPMGKAADLKKGQWCIAIGHPGGFQKGRTPVVRVGRILSVSETAIVTDCTLVGGDSGGPLFDLEGRVIGIHSRIGGSIAANVHVPIDTYHETWDRLAEGEVWGGRSGPFLGVEGDLKSKECRIARVLPGSPAAKGGLMAGDIITKINGEAIGPYKQLGERLSKMKPGAKVKLEVKRDDDIVMLEITLGKR